MRLNNTVLLVSAIAAVISVTMAIGRLPTPLLFIVVLFLFVLTALLYVTLNNKQLLCRLYVLPYGKTFVMKWCRLLGEQIPLPIGSQSDTGYRLENPTTIQDAIDFCCHYCRGYEDVARKIVSHLSEQLVLRKQRSQVMTQHPPLASYLLVGQVSSGKSYFLRVMAHSVLIDRQATVVDIEQWLPDPNGALLGPKGLLMQAVKQDPYSFFVLEKCEAMTEPLCATMTNLMRQGQITDDNGRPVSFSNCVFVFTTSLHCEPLYEAIKDISSRGASRTKASELLCEEAGFNNDFLSRLTDIFVTSPPTVLQQAEVVALQFVKECSAHGVRLEYVDPEILAGQVSELKNEQGYSQLPDRVRDFLRQPLVHAATCQASRISLKVQQAN